MPKRRAVCFLKVALQPPSISFAKRTRSIAKIQTIRSNSLKP